MKDSEEMDIAERIRKQKIQVDEIRMVLNYAEVGLNNLEQLAPKKNEPSPFHKFMGDTYGRHSIVGHHPDQGRMHAWNGAIEWVKNQFSEHEDDSYSGSWIQKTISEGIQKKNLTDLMQD